MAEKKRMCSGPHQDVDAKPSEAEVRAAIETLKAHLDAEWISEGCEADHAFGCASCQAVFLKRELDSLVGWLDD